MCSRWRDRPVLLARLVVIALGVAAVALFLVHQRVLGYVAIVLMPTVVFVGLYVKSHAE